MEASNISFITVNIIEFTVPWENSTKEAYERKKLCYTELAADTQQRGWNVKINPVEVGCRGFVASSTIRLLKKTLVSTDRLCNR